MSAPDSHPSGLDMPTPGAAVAESARSLWQGLQGLTHAHLRLATLEMQLAGESLVTMIAAGLMVAVLLVSAWLVLVAAAVMGLVGGGVPLFAALSFAALINLFAALSLYGVVRRRSRYLGFPASMRSLGAEDLGMPS